MSAKDMFESLGYNIVDNSDEFVHVSYSGETCKIVFCKDGFIEYRDTVGNNEICFYFDELPAMVEQCKELGWLEWRQ